MRKDHVVRKPDGSSIMNLCQSLNADLEKFWSDIFQIEQLKNIFDLQILKELAFIKQANFFNKCVQNLKKFFFDKDLSQHHLRDIPIDAG